MHSIFSSDMSLSTTLSSEFLFSALKMFLVNELSQKSVETHIKIKALKKS